MMHINVKQKPGENAVSLIRRFQRLVRGATLVQTVKGRRYYSRDNSYLKTKNRALRNIKTAAHFDVLRKLGKIGGLMNGDGREQQNRSQ